MIKESLSKLVAGEHLTREEAHACMREIMGGEATPAQIGAYITALRIRGETPDVIAGSVEAMRENFTAVKTDAEVVLDTCGTGGDSSHTFNISTAVAFVAAGAGVTVAKHGNRSVSSKCGSADVLEALGIDISVDAQFMEHCLKEIGMAFLFAPSLHPAMKHAIGPRREIGVRTIFNILGPLSNPAGAQYALLGVYSEEVAYTMAEAAADLGAKHLFVVHGKDGLDEVTITGPTYVAEVKDGQVHTYEIHPDDVGLPVATAAALVGGDPEENAKIIKDILNGEPGPKRNIVLMNAAVALVAAGVARELKEGLALASDAIDSGAAKKKLQLLAEKTQAYAAS